MIATGGLLVAAVATLAGAQGTTDGADLTAAGATFPYPIYSKWFADYAAKTGVKINYQPIGSGGGIRQLQEQTVDFGASDAPMSDDEMSRAKGSAVLHFPTVLGAGVLLGPLLARGVEVTVRARSVTSSSHMRSRTSCRMPR